MDVHHPRNWVVPVPRAPDLRHITYTYLVRCICEKDEHRVNEILKRGIVTKEEMEEEDLLKHAVAPGRDLRIVNRLLEFGVNPNVPFGPFNLHVLEKCELSMEMVMLLYRHGASVPFHGGNMPAYSPLMGRRKLRYDTLRPIQERIRMLIVIMSVRCPRQNKVPFSMLPDDLIRRLDSFIYMRPEL